MSDKTKLLPCPFCGGKAKVSIFPGAHNVRCENRPVKCGNRAMFTVEQWNTRAVPAEDVRAVVDEPFGYWCSPHGMPLHGLFNKTIEPATEEYCEVTPLYRHPQRPVAMPKRRTADSPEINQNGHLWWREEKAADFNACLDEFTRLNP